MSNIEFDNTCVLGSRDAKWDSINEHEWDILIIGGGITGAGVLREVTKLGLRCLLVEQQDFSWGTSSRSSKMVHGGLRYLTQGDVKLTHEAVAERQRLLDEAPGLVNPMKYVYPFKKGEFPGKWTFNIVLSIYDLFAGRSDYQTFNRDKIRSFFPGINDNGLSGGTQYTDAVTDDSRLVMRVLHESVQEGGTAINYVSARDLIRDANNNGRVIGAVLENQHTKETSQVRAKAVVSATGAWADMMRDDVVKNKRIRPLRGSHLVVPSWRLPVYQALAFHHVVDKRFTFIYPWEGVTVIGTTDVDHNDNLNIEAGISRDELAYLLAGVNAEFPVANITEKDILTTWSGVRPIVVAEDADIHSMKPSDLKRSHSVWNNHGLITVTGGKLTTFRTMAVDVLAELADVINVPNTQTKQVFSPLAHNTLIAPQLGCEQLLRLQGFYGNHAQALIDGAHEGELCYIPGSLTLWAELRWHCKHEAVEHLDDIMLRRTRLGLVLKRGGLNLMCTIRTIVQHELQWSDACWEDELSRYTHIWTTKYSLPL